MIQQQSQSHHVMVTMIYIFIMNKVVRIKFIVLFIIYIKVVFYERGSAPRKMKASGIKIIGKI